MVDPGCMGSPGSSLILLLHKVLLDLIKSVMRPGKFQIVSLQAGAPPEALRRAAGSIRKAFRCQAAATWIKVLHCTANQSSSLHWVIWFLLQFLSLFIMANSRSLFTHTHYRKCNLSLLRFLFQQVHQASGHY